MGGTRRAREVASRSAHEPDPEPHCHVKPIEVRKLSRHEPCPVAWNAAEMEELKVGSIVGTAFAAAVAAVLVRTMHPTVAGGDSGELMGAACELGVAHPPGYPLFTMLSWLGTQVIPFGSPGYRLNLVSVIFAVLAAYFHYFAMLRWHLGLVKKRYEGSDCTGQCRGSAWVALISSGMLAFCPLIWQYSTHAEVFAMNNMFVTILLYLSVRYVQDRTVVWARLGALFIGLGLSNQHTLLLYALPLVACMMILGRNQLVNAQELSILMALGLLGLTPYLYLFWAATNAPLGSWGDTSTLSGWPAVGFWTHFLRKEYGTLKLYSGDDGQVGLEQLVIALKLYAANLLTVDSMYAGGFAVAGVVFALKEEGVWSLGGMMLLMLSFYMGVFNYLANLPLDKPLYFGVHQRFWMQAHLIAFGFIGIGMEGVLSVVRLRNNAVLPSLAALLVSAQLASNFGMQDQSANWHVWNFGHFLIDARPQHSMLFTQGDLITNSIRYLQRCEKQRLDIAHLDMPMMTYEWFASMHGPHFPYPRGGSPVVFPGVQFAVGGKRLVEHRRCCSYSMKQFLDANWGSKRPMYIMGGWYGSEKRHQVSTNSLDGAGDIPGYETEVVGAGARIVKYKTRMKKKEWKEEAGRFKVPSLLPDLAKYDEKSWERTLVHNYITHAMSLAVSKMDKAIAKGKEFESSPWIKEQKTIQATIAELEKLLYLAEKSGYLLDDVYRNLGIGYGRLKCESGGRDYPQIPCEGQTKMREYMQKFLNVTKKPPAETQSEQTVVNNPTAFINLG